MKLTKENIDFIDNYLKNSGVTYIDIRYEMTDHVATTLEAQQGNFNDCFKQYMYKNKTNLLTANKRFANAALNRAFYTLAFAMLRPVSLIVFVVSLALTFLALQYTSAQQVNDGLGLVFSCAAIMGLLYIKFSPVKAKSNYSVIDKIRVIVLWVVVILFGFIKLHKLLTTPNELLLFYGVLLAFTVISMRTFYTLTKKYNMRYEMG